jgi:hypothetical protein
MGYFGLTEQELVDFKKWSGVNNLSINEMHEWNNRHGHLLKLDPSNCPQDDLPKMIAIWREFRLYQD